MAATVSTGVLRFEKNRAALERPDELAAEEPLEIRVEGHTLAVVMRTPGHDRELAAGFLLSEGILKSARDIFDLSACVSAGGNVIDVALRRPGRLDFSKLSRHVITSSSCGICSKTSIGAVLKRRRPLGVEWRVEFELLARLPARLQRAQEVFQRTGGLHGCALFTLEGELLALREDVGRHNALDKLIGMALLEKGTPLKNRLLLLSGRSSFEMLQKAYAAGLPLIAAIGAPSSLAVEFARASGQTLIGFLRADSMNVYTGRERVRKDEG